MVSAQPGAGAADLLPFPGLDPDPASGVAPVDLAIVVPAWNEEEGIALTVTRIRSALADCGFSYELVIVDDGSTDRTAERASACGVRVLRLPSNQGYGAALKAGIAATASTFVCIIDADGTYPADAIPRLMALSSGRHMVVGARAPDDCSIPRERRLAKRFLGGLASYLAAQKIPDLNSGLRIMRRSALLKFIHLLPSGFSFTSTITLSLLCSGHSVHYEPIACSPRVGTSKIRAAHFQSFVLLVLRTVVLFNPLKIFLPLGLILFGIGLAKFIYDVLLWNLSETAVMAFLAAIVVWSVGLLADMIARLQLKPPGAL
jgi:glycosyltransferase involved in cell wall biosynthesis